MSKKFFEKIDQEFLNIFREKVSKAKSIVISSHIAPDDDSISSVLSIHYYLTEIAGIEESKVKVFYTWQATDKWAYFPRYSKINFVEDLYDHVEKDDLIIFLDGSGWRRFSRKAEIKNLDNFVICIDHHPTPEDKFDLHLVAREYTSTAETIYRLFFEKEKPDKEICEILLMGILGDTGNFKFVKPYQSEILKIAERLVREGEIIVEDLQSKYQAIELLVYEALQELMRRAEIKEVEGWPRFLVSYLTGEFIKSKNLNEDQVAEASSLFTPFLKNIKGVGWGMVLTPRLADGTCRISLRSVPNSVSVRTMVEEMKIGGGHDRAAGAKILKSDPVKALDVIFDWMRKNKPVIN